MKTRKQIKEALRNNEDYYKTCLEEEEEEEINTVINTLKWVLGELS